MERLLVAGIDRHLRRELRRVVERADLDNHYRHPWPGHHVRAALRTKLARYRLFEVAAGKLLRYALGVFEAIRRHGQKQIRRATTDVLTFAAVTLSHHDRLTFGKVAHSAAIASAFQSHGNSPTSRPKRISAVALNVCKRKGGLSLGDGAHWHADQLFRGLPRGEQAV